MTLHQAIETAKNKAAGNVRWTRAIERAAEGLLSGELVVTLLQHDALVTSSNGSYRVNGSCQCEAARRGHRECKHRAAVRLVEMVETAPAKSIKSSTRPVGLIEPTITRSIERDHTGVAVVAVRCNGWLI